MDGLGRDAVRHQALGHLVGAVLGAREHDDAGKQFILQQVGEHVRLGAGIDHDRLLVDALYGDFLGADPHLLGIVQELRGDLCDVLRHGRREQQRLALRRQQREDLPHVAHEAHVEHAVGLVEHQDRYLVEPQVFLADEVEKPARRGDDDIGPPSQRIDLRVLADAAVDDRVAQPQVRAVSADALADLAGQFAGRCENEGTRRRGSLRPGSSLSRCKMGSTKAAVLPVPVWAMPRRSRPASRAGMAWRWMGVGSA